MTNNGIFETLESLKSLATINFIFRFLLLKLQTPQPTRAFIPSFKPQATHAPALNQAKSKAASRKSQRKMKAGSLQHKHYYLALTALLLSATHSPFAGAFSPSLYRRNFDKLDVSCECFNNYFVLTLNRFVFWLEISLLTHPPSPARSI